MKKMKWTSETPWTQEEGINLARAIEALAPQAGAHIGLTGGLLYKDGPRKDLDIVVYRIRQAPEIHREKFFRLLRIACGIKVTQDYGFVVKATQDDRVIDFLFPDYVDGTYEGGPA